MQIYELTSRYLSDDVIEKLRNEIIKNNYGEIFIKGRINNNNYIIDDIDIIYRGNSEAVIYTKKEIFETDIIIHNHPNDNLNPSVADLNLAHFCAENGIGFAIIDNKVEKINFVVDPFKILKTEEIDSNEIKKYLTGEKGKIKELIKDFIVRESQIKMAEIIIEAINKNKTLVLEAGTGTGKSFAYLIPSIFFSIKNKRRVIISTNTIALQKQLLLKDLPSTAIITEKKDLLKYSHLMGRNNYICKYRLNYYLENNLELFNDNTEYKIAKKIKEIIIKNNDQYSILTFEDLPFTVFEELRFKINSQSDLCLKLKCPFYSECLYYKAKLDINKSNIVIVNHHLFVSALISDNENNIGILPDFHTLIFDEAHNIEKIIEKQCIKDLSLNNLLKFVKNALIGKGNKIREDIKSYVEKMYDFISLYSNSNGNIVKLKNSFFELYYFLNNFFNDYEDFLNKYSLILNQPYSIDKIIENFKSFNSVFEIIKRISLSLNDFLIQIKNIFSGIKLSLEELNKINDKRFFFSRKYFENFLFKRFSKYFDIMELFLDIFNKINNNEYDLLNFENESFVLWITFKKNDIVFSTFNFKDKENVIKLINTKPETKIFTSATLTINNKFNYFVNSLSLDKFDQDLIEKQFGSPFDYNKQVKMYIPNNLPEPSDKNFISYIIEPIKKIIKINKGKAFILTTSYNSLKQLYNSLKNFLEEEKIMLYAQGIDYSKEFMIKKFKEDINSVLIGTATYWEGIDVPGEALSLLIITKLPFSVPDDPILNAKKKRLQRKGKNIFFEILIPEAVIKFKQGFGRLIRKEKDKGFIIVFDKRLKTKNYGKIFLNSLPVIDVKFNNINDILNEIRSKRSFINGEKDETNSN